MLRSLLLLSLCLQAARLAAACGPGATRCDPAGRQLLGCGADRSWSPLRDCEGGCGAGRCAGPEPASDGGRAAALCEGHAGQMVCSGGCGGALGFCTAAGEWLQTQECAPGQTCASGSCKSDASCPGNQVIRCLTDGDYPDLYDCGIYWSCRATSSSANKYSCSTGLMYDACYRSCSVRKHVSGDECAWRRRLPCLPGEAGPAPNNDRMFYLCSRDTITWSQCPYGHWDKAKGRCVDEHVPGCGSLALPQPGCDRPGPEPVPGTDCSFFYCYQNGTHTVVDCPDNYHFDRETGACVQGKCT